MVQDVIKKPDLPPQSQYRGQLSKASAEPVQFPQPQPSSRDVDQKDLGDILQRVSEELQKAGPQLQMEVDSDLGRVIVKVLDSQSGQVIRQIPAQELVSLAKELKSLNGLLVKRHA
ncbi:MAG TPA: flagellar protein FlaG [Nitrospira sp.]|nr:flagellar protein FlaG [Nitrospira sp.]